MKTLNLHLLQVAPGSITNELVLNAFQEAHPQHPYQAALANALESLKAHIEQQNLQAELLPTLISTCGFAYECYSSSPIHDAGDYLKSELHTEIVNVYRGSNGPDQDNNLSGKEINRRSDEIAEKAVEDRSVLVKQVVEALLPKLAEQTGLKTHSVDVSIISGLHKTNCNIIQRLLFDNFDDECGHLSNSSQFYYENRALDVINAYFILMDGLNENDSVQKTYDSIVKGLNLFNEVIEKLGKISAIGFLKANYNQYYYTLPYAHSKPLDILLEKQFGASNIISMAKATFGHGWKESVLQSGINKIYDLLTLDDLEQLSEQSIAPESVSTAIYAICKAHADNIDSVKAKLNAYREKISVNMI